MATESEDAWTLGPAESRLIRVCLYLAEGSLGGLLLFWVVAGGQLVLPDLLAGNRWVLAVGAVLVLALARWASFWLWFRRAIRDESHERWWLLRDWLSVYRPSILVAITLLLGVGLLALDQHGLRLPQSEAFSYWFELLFVAAACNALAGALSSKGELDAESLTLRTYRYGQWRELDLRMVSSVHRVNTGDDALL
ncbi:hypothetical protein [Halorussus halophilus]|uniref:hypothetical protein n=1 Tax=Halorussus halophilus TaxID=2650975 RepID=UPI00130115C3|nr:hypothetical protein [Halorussus halophilus]